MITLVLSFFWTLSVYPWSYQHRHWHCWLESRDNEIHKTYVISKIFQASTSFSKFILLGSIRLFPHHQTVSIYQRKCSLIHGQTKICKEQKQNNTLLNNQYQDVHPHLQYSHHSSNIENRIHKVEIYIPNSLRS